jgi:ribosomal protein S27AE
MAVWVLACPDCGNQFPALVMAGSAQPRAWECSRCGSTDVAPVTVIEHDPLMGQGCGCGCL